MNRFDLEVKYHQKMERLHDLRLEAMAANDHLMANRLGTEIWQHRGRQLGQLMRQRELEWGGRIPPHP